MHKFVRQGSPCRGTNPPSIPAHKFCDQCGKCELPACCVYSPHLTEGHHGHPRFYELVEEIKELHERKNQDYASGTKEGPLGNFERVSVIMKLYPGLDWDSPLGVTTVYMLKQLDAALTLRSQKRESVTDEPIQSRLRDVTVYSLIGQIQIEEEENVTPF